jgi:DNA-binding transcriptional MerR regulator/effector-binding domain-containing protein
MEKWLLVGEVSKMFNLNVQTLHYYESIKLFTPVSRDSNGYRLYKFDQIYTLASICYLKKLGYSLKKIREYLDSRDIELSLNQMKSHSTQIIKKMDDLKRINDVIQRKIQFIEEKKHNIDISSINTVNYPRRFYIPIGSEELLYRSDDFYLYPTVVFYKADKKQFGALITSDAININFGSSPKEIPAGNYFCGYHKGPYNEIAKTFNRIQEQAIEQGLTLTDESVSLNIIDQFVEIKKEKYITEVQFRIIQK